MLTDVHSRFCTNIRLCNVATFLDVSFKTFIEPFNDGIPFGALQFIQLFYVLEGSFFDQWNLFRNEMITIKISFHQRNCLLLNDIESYRLVGSSTYNSPHLVSSLYLDCLRLCCTSLSASKRIQMKREPKLVEIRNLSYQMHFWSINNILLRVPFGCH